MRVTLRHVAAAVSVIGIAACSDKNTLESTIPNGDGKLSVVLSVHADTIPQSLSKFITARVTDQTGALKLVPVEWKTSDASVASVSGGTITGVGAGTAMIIASAGGGADSASIVVTPKEYTLDVQPSAAVVALGDTINFKATIRSNTGDVIAVNNLTWSSSDTVAARFVNGGSLVTTGEGELSVSAEAVYGRGTGNVKVFRTPVASVTISPGTANVYVGAKVELDVTLRDQQGRLADGTVTFGSSNYSKATVNQDGIVTGIASGTVVITATSGTKTGSATINVLGTPTRSPSAWKCRPRQHHSTRRATNLPIEPSRTRAQIPPLLRSLQREWSRASAVDPRLSVPSSTGSLRRSASVSAAVEPQRSRFHRKRHQSVWGCNRS
jgi:uncharacterized protein YjdB